MHACINLIDNPNMISSLLPNLSLNNYFVFSIFMFYIPLLLLSFKQRELKLFFFVFLYSLNKHAGACTPTTCVCYYMCMLFLINHSSMLWC